MRRSIKILHVTVADTGGAGVACRRLHRALRDLGIESKMSVRTRSLDDPDTYAAGSRWNASLRTRLDGLPLYLHPRRRIFAWWSVNWLSSKPRTAIGVWEPDLIHAHWIGDGFVPLAWFTQVRKPIVWTMHDMWPFTGGCHYTGGCQRFHTGCGSCPQLGSTRAHDLSFRSARAKAKAWNPFPGALVSPGHWLAEAARQSVVFRDCTVRVIPNGLDGTLFRPEGRREARQRLGIAQDAKVILTGAMGAVTDNRKGFSLLADALQRCRQTARADNWHLLVFGADSGPSQSELGLPVIYGGKVAVEEQLPRYYQAGDVYALPSLQDNLPNTVVESLACGTPVVGFRSSGPASMIVDGKTGKLAEPFSSASLAEALQDVLSRDQSNWQAACRREFEDRYAHPGPAIQYVNLYEELLGGSSRPSEISASHSLIQ